MPSPALPFARDPLAARQAVSFALSLLLHGSFLALVTMLPRVEPPSPPLEISIVPGPPGPASPPPGEKSAEPGPIGPPPERVEPAPKAAPKRPPDSLPAPRRRVAAPAPPRFEDQGVLGALRRVAPEPPAGTRVFEGPASSVQLRERATRAEAAPLPLGAARERAEAAVGAEVFASGPAVRGSLAEGVGSVVLPGPGGSGSGWGGGGEGSGGGGTGRGGFSVTGAGAGGAGRSYASIWNYTQRYLAGLRWAYNNELRRDPNLRGVLVVRYEILPNGVVDNVSLVSSGLRHPGLEQEVLRQIRTWRYPPEPTGSVIVVWPFSFVPPSG